MTNDERAKHGFPPQQTQANQLVQELRDQIVSYVLGMSRYRWRALIVAWVAGLTSWIAVLMMPPVYQASARIYVDTEDAIRPLLRGIASSADVMSEVTVVTREMLSRPNLAEVARQTDLDLRADTEEEFEALLQELQSGINVAGNRDNIYSISYSDPDRLKAIEVVDSLVNTFVEKSLNADREEASQAQSFLQSQIDEYEARLTEAEDRLTRFRQENMQFLPDQAGNYFARLQTATEQLEQAESELRLAQNRRAELIRQLEGEEPVFGIMTQSRQSSGSNASGPNAAKIRELELQLEELRLQYTDKHPRIGQILETIDLLKQQDANAVANSPAPTDDGASGPMTSLETNPVYQNMRVQLANIEVDIASLSSQVQEQRRQVTTLKSYADSVPQVEAELGRLNRDYGVIQSKYQQLLEQLETANIGEEVDLSIDEVQFRVIEPPFAPLEATGPNRPMLISGGLAFGLVLGLGLAFLLDQLHPAFFSGRDVNRITGLPVLGVVGDCHTVTESARRSKGLLRFAMAAAALVVVFASLVVFADPISLAVRGLVGAVA